jgi:hypothetical protein
MAIVPVMPSIVVKSEQILSMQDLLSELVLHDLLTFSHSL